jgi:AbrB family looped-hinge helix DNA binding protein
LHCACRPAAQRSGTQHAARQGAEPWHLEKLGQLSITIFKWLNPTENGIMDGKVTLDRAGRIVLPKGVRDELHLSPGDTLDFSVQGDEVTLRARRNSTPLQKERGIRVLRTGKLLSVRETDELLRDIREQRIRKSLGESR